MKPFTRLQMCRLVEKFETYRTVCDRRKETSGLTRTARSGDNIQTLGVMKEETPIKSVRSVK